MLSESIILQNPCGVVRGYKEEEQNRCRCHCTIIPPHITDKITEAFKDPEKRARFKKIAAKHAELRKHRAQLFAAPSIDRELQKQEATVKIYDAQNKKALPGLLISSPEVSNDLEVIEAYKSSIKVYDFYQKVFGRNSIDGKGMDILSSVHYNKEYDNAFWQGEQMVYGDGDGVIFERFTIDLDVTGHELTHGVTQYDNELEYQNQSGAINESLSDIFGSMLKQYASNQSCEEADWLIGHELMIGNQYSLRSLKAPGTAYKGHPELGDDPQPATMDDYRAMDDDNGGVHINSGIPNHAFYLMTNKLYLIDKDKYRYSWESTGPIWYEAKRNLSPQATFYDLVNVTSDAAEKHFGKESLEHKAVKEAWAEVKLLGGKPAPSGHKERKCSLM